jgi:hypothetical protein
VRNKAPAGAAQPDPLALVVFLENVGHITGLHLPRWVMNTIDYVTEEYAKLLLHLYGAYRRYDRIIVLEDALATGPHLAAALLDASCTHTVDVLLLVHGRDGMLVGHQARQLVGSETFDDLRQRRQSDPACLNLRVVYGLNCFGLSLAPVWLALGAKAVNGSPGVNWFPEPSLSVFLRNWLHGRSYGAAVVASNTAAERWWRTILHNKTGDPDQDHPWLTSSRQVVFGVHDVTIN